MARRKPRKRIYWRNQGIHLRAYGDFRDFGDVEGGREALIPEGATTATTDPVIAESLVADRLAELQEKRRNKTLLGIERQATLKGFTSHHLVQKRRAGRVGRQHLKALQQRLQVAVEFFGEKQDVALISVQDVQRWTNHLGSQPKRAPSRCPECRATARHRSVPLPGEPTP